MLGKLQNGNRERIRKNSAATVNILCWTGSVERGPGRNLNQEKALFFSVQASGLCLALGPASKERPAKEKCS